MTEEQRKQAEMDLLNIKSVIAMNEKANQMTAYQLGIISAKEYTEILRINNVKHNQLH
jgi:hypothetical protein